MIHNENNEGTRTVDELLASLEQREIATLPKHFIGQVKGVRLVQLAKRGNVLVKPAEWNDAMVVSAEGKRLSVVLSEVGNKVLHTAMPAKNLWQQGDGSVVIVKESGTVYRLTLNDKTSKADTESASPSGWTIGGIVRGIRKRLGI